MSGKGPLEKVIERRSLRLARAKGDWARKFASPGRRSVPDDVLLTYGFSWFCEFKREGEKLTALQTEEHKAILLAKGIVFTASSVEEFWLHREAIIRYRSSEISWMGLRALSIDSFRKYQEDK